MSAIRRLFGRDADILRHRNFQILILANLMAPLGPALVSPILDSLTGPFGTSGTAIGLMISAFTAPGILLIPVVGVLADRYGRRIVLIFGLVVFGLGGLAIALTTDFRVVLALRVLQGVGAAGLIPVIVTSIGDMYEDTTEATGQGLRYFSTGLSQTLFPAVAGFAVLAAWQYPFLLYGLSLPIAAVVALWFEEPADPGSRGDHVTAGDLAGLLSRPPVLSFLVVVITPAFLYFGFVTYVSVLVSLNGGTAAQAGLIVAANSIAKAAVGSQAGRITSAFQTRVAPLLAANGLMAAGLAIFALGPGLVSVLTGSVVFGAGFGVGMTLYRSLATTLAPRGLRASLVSAVESLIRLGATTAPIAIGAAVALLEPTLGFAGAVRWVLAGVGFLVAGVAVVGLLLLQATRP